MKSLIITVAGTATRFNRDTREQTLKCLHYIGQPQNCLLYRILEKATDFDEFIIVGGFLYEKLCAFIEAHFQLFAPRIKTVFNPEFTTFGSGYSLIKGIEAVSAQADEVVFAEGDLFFDDAGFERVKNSEREVITVNYELIDARKAVVLYQTESGQFRYLYDTNHRTLSITEPFIAVYNSGQVWKFCSIEKLRKVVAGLSLQQQHGTNLEIIQGYFGGLSAEQVEIVPFRVWLNCNTVADYEKVYALITQ